LSCSGKVLATRETTFCSPPPPGSTHHHVTFTTAPTSPFVAKLPVRHGRRSRAATTIGDSRVCHPVTPEFFEQGAGIVWASGRTDVPQRKRSPVSVSPQRMRSKTIDVPSRYLDHSSHYAEKQCMQSRRRILQDSRRSQGDCHWLISDEELIDPRLLRRSPEPRKFDWARDTDAAPVRAWNAYSLERDVLLVSPDSVRLVDAGKARKATIVFEWASAEVCVVDLPAPSFGKGSMRVPYSIFEGRAQRAEPSRQWSVVYHRDENSPSVCMPTFVWEQVCAWHRSVCVVREASSEHELIVIDPASSPSPPPQLCPQRPPFRLVLAAEPVAQVGASATPPFAPAASRAGLLSRQDAPKRDRGRLEARTLAAACVMLAASMVPTAYCACIHRRSPPALSCFLRVSARNHPRGCGQPRPALRMLTESLGRFGLAKSVWEAGSAASSRGRCRPKVSLP
jgi:hypothetical protein